MHPTVLAVHRSATHTFSKQPCDDIAVEAGLGVRGDAHSGITVRHRSRLAKDPSQPNLRQIHLIHAELLDALNDHGFDIRPGALGENVTTRGVDLLALPTGTRLRLGADVVVEITGLRNPCRQIEAYRRGLLAKVLDRDAAGRPVRKAGVMGIVLVSGVVRAGDEIGITLPQGPHRALVPV